jgi:5-methylcytosine-specific restriction endonuclease McrA
MSRPVLTQLELLRRRCRLAWRHHRARARALGQGLDYTAGDLEQRALSTPCCAYCQRPTSFGDLTWDHEHPIARGGALGLANLRLTCSRCNRLKGQLTLREYLQLTGLLAGLHPASAADLERRLLAGGRAYAGGRRKGGGA